MIFSILSLLIQAAWIEFFEKIFLWTLIFTYSSASNSLIFQ